MASPATAAGVNFQGSLVALVTPMQPDGSLDYAAYRSLIDWHVQEGTDALVVVGTTGESPTVSMEEHAELIRVAVEHAAGRIPVIAGVGANSTDEAIHLTNHAKAVGAQAGLSVVPYYNKPSQEGLYRHFRTIAEAVDLPTILYNVPGRTVADMTNETVLRLAQVPGIIGIKDATGDIARGGLLLREAPAGFQVFSGDDPTAAALILLGARGNISVTANVAPKLMRDLCAAALAGDVPKVRELNAYLARLNKALFVEANPIPVKWALAEMGKSALGYRLPLVELGTQNHETVRRALQETGLL
ncbi:MULTISPECIES: 4-hydroxy-tetrahydrodipicolinate synthase [Achromobacter]|uniref:4-hydroxy-tetrahydrodipicolinate synthase n=2 Tax=Achromobacter piechaudii TaxID=72556 RepID=A0A6S7DJX1_9BURK|nr:4-hydroxy-tetrahydrodipicolinate synthase [Achromobacter piechaudii]EFF74053.1 dihydrodipicolinate synthase [Achromobacter piechaudii ATCC 43553]KNY09392.1 dihydrodipicolinate synthase [Achromobacter piechaudii]MPS76642.1 4-hydroxy-tetrahydrodipicolinate synthase [Achromobacter sp.]CAB3705363.1 4-hydroxy-tetrahydrodipicolinate synthase [Achromobacter piechaudii]CAB3846634.1 4-hydroxy-tetrahydrodipicolinate synthase [Achromobacter piechaudii]